MVQLTICFYNALYRQFVREHGVQIFFSLAETDASGKTMDERRKEHVAYEYLCHLEEAKKLVKLMALSSVKFLHAHTIC